MSKSPQEEVKERVWKTLTLGLDPENDELGCIDDIKDNVSYAIDVAIFETANAILNDIEKADDSLNRGILNWFKMTWLVPVRDPELTVPDVSMPDWIEETPTGKKAAKKAKEIVQSIEEHQKQMKEKTEKFVQLIEGMRISNRGNVGIGSGKSKRKHSSIEGQKKQAKEKIEYEKRFRRRAYE